MDMKAKTDHPVLKSLFLSVAIVGQFLFVGPLYILSANAHEFSVSVWDLTKYLIPLSFAGVLLVTCPLAVALRRSKFKALVAVFSAVTLYLYLQFYFFVWDYGILDGREINWSDFNFVSAIEVLSILFLLLIALKFPEKFIRIAFLILPLLLISEGVVTGYRLSGQNRQTKVENQLSQYAKLSDYLHTGKGQLTLANSISRKNNILIILVDTFQSDFFEEIITTDRSIKNELDGFIFFKNASGVFPYTTLTIPSILTGQEYQPGEKIGNFIDRISKYNIANFLEDKGWKLSSVPLESRGEYLSANSITAYEFSTLLDLSLFRHAPHLLKPYVLNDYRFLIRPHIAKSIPSTESEIDLAIFRSLIKNMRMLEKKPIFKFLHFWGVHPPAMVDEKCSPCEVSHKKSAIQKQAYCMMVNVIKYLNKIKDKGCYNSSMIFLIADTGSKYGVRGNADDKSENSELPRFVQSSAHPLIAVKNFDSHGPMKVSSAPASLLDISATIMEIMHGDAEDFPGKNLLVMKEKTNRLRKFYYYKGSEEVRMEYIPYLKEYLILGDIRDPKSWRVGNEYWPAQKSAPIMQLVDFGNPEATKFQDLGWSVEARGYHVSCTISKTVALTGILPDKEKVIVTAKIMNHHADQTLEVQCNGQPVATWEIDSSGSWSEYFAEIKLSERDRRSASRVVFKVAKTGILNEKDPRILGVCFDWVRFE